MGGEEVYIFFTTPSLAGYAEITVNPAKYIEQLMCTLRST